MILNYYYPYVSGVSECAKILSENLAKSGYSVTVLTSNHNNLPEVEIINGVKVIRAPILFKISKGTVSPAFISFAKKLSKQADIVHMHLPMLESGIISKLIDKSKLIITYQCDIVMQGIIGNGIQKIMDINNNVALKNSKSVLVSSLDYGKHSRIAAKYKEKMHAPCLSLKEYSPNMSIKKDLNKKTIGFCGRIVEEKGITVLIDAFAKIKKSIPEATLIIGGDYENVAGGSIFQILKKEIEDKKIKDIEFIGKIPEEDMSSFYTGLDVFVLPSINPTEAFGLVQIEAMLCGTPVVASDLYGVRTIIENTKMGLVSKKGNSTSLADCIIQVLSSPSKYIKSREEILSFYSNKKSLEDHIKCYKMVLEG